MMVDAINWRETARAKIGDTGDIERNHFASIRVLFGEIAV